MYNKFVVEDCFPLDIMKEWQGNEEPGSLFIQEQERIYMKKELEYFYIENSFGGNQDWFRDYWMLPPRLVTVVFQWKKQV